MRRRLIASTLILLAAADFVPSRLRAQTAAQQTTTRQQTTKQQTPTTTPAPAPTEPAAAQADRSEAVAAADQQREPAKVVVVPAGTPVEVEAAYLISSAEVRAGDTLRFRVVRPVEVGDATVIAAGAVATARVVEAKKGRPFGKAGRLAFEMRDVEVAGGRKIPLGFAGKLKGDSKSGTVATAVAVTAVLFLPAAPLWGFKRGKSAVVPPGKIFNAIVSADTPVEVVPKQRKH